MNKKNKNISDEEGKTAIKAVKKKYARKPDKKSSIAKDLPSPPAISDEEGEAAIKAVKKTYRTGGTKNENTVPSFKQFYNNKDIYHT